MTKGKSVSKRLTLLSMARNLTHKQEHQLVALADRTRKMEAELAALTALPTFPVDLPCPDCEQRRLVGYRLDNEKGEHMHTNYVCTFWASRTLRACGWHGWTIPDYREAES